MRLKHDSSTKDIYDRFDRLIEVEQGSSTWSYTYVAFNRKSLVQLKVKLLTIFTTAMKLSGPTIVNKMYDLKILSVKEGSIPIAMDIWGS